MADATRLLCCKSSFILNVFVTITILADINLARFEVLKESSLSNITAAVNDRCTLVALHPTNNAGLVSIIRKLSEAFKNEIGASIGVLKQTDVNLITWQNSKSRDFVERGDMAFFSAQNCRQNMSFKTKLGKATQGGTVPRIQNS